MRALLTAAALAFIAGCTTTPPATVPVTLLAPHPEPSGPLQTNEDLLIYALECRQELRLCNAHKRDARDLLNLPPFDRDKGPRNDE